MPAKVRVVIELEPWQWKALLAVVKHWGFRGRVDRPAAVHTLVSWAISQEVQAWADALPDLETVAPGALGVQGWHGRAVQRHAGQGRGSIGDR